MTPLQKWFRARSADSILSPEACRAAFDEAFEQDVLPLLHDFMKTESLDLLETLIERTQSACSALAAESEMLGQSCESAAISQVRELIRRALDEMRFGGHTPTQELRRLDHAIRRSMVQGDERCRLVDVRLTGHHDATMDHLQRQWGAGLFGRRTGSKSDICWLDEFKNVAWAITIHWQSEA